MGGRGGQQHGCLRDRVFREPISVKINSENPKENESREERWEDGVESGKEWE